MLTRVIKRQLILFGILTAVALLVLGIYYLRLPTLMGIGQYQLKADLPASGGLYPTSNVTYRGVTIGKVTAVEPTEKGAEATMSIDSNFKIPLDAVANVHSVSAVGEQYLDLVSQGKSQGFFSPGQRMTKGTVPSEIGPALDTANRGLSVLPKDKIGKLLDETSDAVGGLGPALQRLVDSTQAIVGDFKTNINQVDDIIQNSAPILDSQAVSSNAIDRWARNLNILGKQTAQQDSHLKSILTQAAPTADQVNSVFSDVRESLPQTLANTEIVVDMLKRYHPGLEQIAGDAAAAWLDHPGDLRAVRKRPDGRPGPHAGDQLSGAVSDRVPPCAGVAIAVGHQHRPAAGQQLLPDPAGFPGQRGARRAQHAVYGCPRQTGADTGGLPQRKALCAAGDQPVVRRPQPDPELPRPGRALRPGGETGLCDPGAVGQQRTEPAAGQPPATGRADTAAEKRSVAAAGLGLRPVQRATAQPLHLQLRAGRQRPSIVR